MKLQGHSTRQNALQDRGDGPRRVVFVLFLAILLIPPTVSIGSDGFSIRLVNQTRYYLHVLIDNTSLLYVAPGGWVSHQANTLSAEVRVLYSPGQGISGSMDRIVTSSRVENSTTDCNNTHGCTTDASESSSPVILYITPDSLHTTQGLP